MNYDRLKEQIKHHEGFRSKVYKDTLGFDTIGYGFAIKDLRLDEGISSIILERKLAQLIIRCFNKFHWLSKQPSTVQEVVINMCYQLGVTGFSKFRKTIEFIKGEDYIMAGKEMLDSRWAKQTPNRANELSEIMKNA